ncbi:hypothetical protein [Micromonospora sp. NBC_01796]|uniref:hypothetical protein n=1 Tax=Micromonospora sp. NBC_01796 TaxID=2975987 RepID=UPI002DD93046|nr:hypothetical protein [Micromonospora sp. NBC_01796]WSA84304.1 hypothetical protein OIE47_28675 [Micromonospora sp. NBC_01796]
MTRHRSRSRWFRRSALALAALLLPTVGAVGFIQAPANADPVAGVITIMTNPSAYRLSSYTAPEDSGGLMNIGRSMTARTIDWVMSQANRNREPLCHASTYSALTSRAGANPVGFCWDSDTTDDSSTAWVPQGITTTRDALSANTYDGHQLVATSWHNADSTSNRISLVDWDATYEDFYRHVLLVEPTNGSEYYKTVAGHAGGLMWYGNLLYVADSARNQFRIFDFNQLFSANVTDYCDSRVGHSYDAVARLDKNCASGYAYIMPQVGTERSIGSPLTLSSMSLDRSTSPDSMVIAEYATQAQIDAGATPRVVRFALDSGSRRPLTGVAIEGYTTKLPRTQGVASRYGTYYFASSGGSATARGALRVWATGHSTFANYPWVIGAESLSYWGGSSDLIWTVTEHVNQRLAVAVNASAYPPS